ncbi:MAG TPA: solute carrier family 23 protein, partial [Defluviitaleaceae bacterium]|nr:solute carrier family 23 protein [Defluviitaleaceae bacterium]
MSSATKVSTTTQEKIILGLQHVLAMFGATVLVPILTGLDPAIAILSAGLGTLVFHLCTKGMVPVFLGSSFAFIPVIALVLQEEGLAAVKGGVIVAGLIYAIMAGVIKLFGVEKVRSFFPPIVAGPIIMVIGLSLSPVAINSSLYNQGSFDVKYLIVSSIVVLTMIIVSIFAKGFFKLVPILIAVVVGYLVSLPLGLVDVE